MTWQQNLPTGSQTSPTCEIVAYEDGNGTLNKIQHRWTGKSNIPSYSTDANGNVTGLVGPNGVQNGASRALSQRLKMSRTKGAIANRFLGMGLQYENQYPAMQAAPNWVISTQYYVGNCVTNGGNTYACLIAGLSAGAGGPSGVGSAPIVDNAVSWAYVGTAPTSMANAPTFAVSGSAPGTTTAFTNAANSYGGINGSTAWIKNNTWFQCLCGTYSDTSSGMYSLTSSLPEFSFMTDDLTPCLVTGSAANCALYILVDDVPITPGLISIGTSGAQYTTITFPFKAARKITVSLNSAAIGFSGVQVANTSQCWSPPTTSTPVRAFFVGDSYISGQAQFFFGQHIGIERKMASLLGINDITKDGVGGSGFSVGTAFNNAARIALIAANSPDVIFCMSSGNDDPSAVGVIQSSALSWMQAARTAAPSATIIVFGSWASSTGPSVTRLGNEGAVAAAVTQFNDPNTFFVPVCTDTVKSWVSGTGKTSATTGIGNSDIYTGADGTHPVYAGADYYARRMAKAVSLIIDAMP